MWPNPLFPADWVAFTEKILHGKLHFLSSAAFKWSIYATSMHYDLRGNKFLRVKSMRYGTESISFLAPKVWEILPNEIKYSETLQVFRANLKK